MANSQYQEIINNLVAGRTVFIPYGIPLSSIRVALHRELAQIPKDMLTSRTLQSVPVSSEHRQGFELKLVAKKPQVCYYILDDTIPPQVEE